MAIRQPSPPLPPDAKAKKRGAAITGAIQKAQDKLTAAMGAKQSAMGACLLAGLCLCSFSWAQMSNEDLCAALDITSSCPQFSTSPDSSAAWSAVELIGAIGDTALRSGMIGDDQRSCLRTSLQRPVRVAFRWQVFSEDREDYLRYIDDGQRNPMTENVDRDEKSLSGIFSWLDASFDYPSAGPVDIEWCYIKDDRHQEREDAGFLDWLRITPLLGSLIITPAQVMLSEGNSAEITLALDRIPQFNVRVNLKVPEGSMGDIAVSPAQAVLSPDQSTVAITVTAREDSNAETRETHGVRAESPVAAAAEMTVITLPDPLPQVPLCAALDIKEEVCPAFTTSDDSLAVWFPIEDSSASGEVALHSGRFLASSNIQRSCLGTELQRPVRVAFRWRVSSGERLGYLHYIDDGRRNPATGGAVTGDKFLSGDVALWRDASFDYPGAGPVDIEWCYITDGMFKSGDDAGFLDQLQITQLDRSLVVRPAQVQLPEGSSATLTLALDKDPQSNVTVNLTVPEGSVNDIEVSPAQAMLSPDQPTAKIVITAIPDDNVEAEETHGVRAESPAAAATVITVTTPPDPLPQEELCEALDIDDKEDCPPFSIPGDNSAIWFAKEVGGAVGGTALRSGAIGNNQRSCLRTELQRPTRVAFRWQVYSVQRNDRLHYIDDGQRHPGVQDTLRGPKFLSGNIPWEDASFDYSGAGPVDIEWCYIRGPAVIVTAPANAGYLDQLRIARLSGSLTVTPAEVELTEGSSAAFTISLSEAPTTNVAVALTETISDITVSSTRVVLSPDRPSAQIVIKVNRDGNAEARETYVVRATNPAYAEAVITIATPSEPLPQDELCDALDIDEEDCPTFSTSDDSSAIWKTSDTDAAEGGDALRSGEIDHSQRSCLGATLRRPVRVAFLWQTDSQPGQDHLLYIDDGRRNPAISGVEAGPKFLSGMSVPWRPKTFNYFGRGGLAIEWCYIKNWQESDGKDRGGLDRLQITQLPGNIIVSPSQVLLPEGDSATLILALDETPESSVTVSLTVQAASSGDITVSISDTALSATQTTLSPDRSTAAITITATPDDNVEPRETHVVRAQSPDLEDVLITVITPPDPLPQDELCAALDIDEEECPTFSTSDDSSAIWSASAVSGMVGDMALRSGMIGDSQRSCLGATLPRPVRVAFRWLVSSQAVFNRLHYIDDGRRSPAFSGVATGDKFLSGDIAWRDASFDYLGDGAIDIEWCYIKDGGGSDGDDAGFLDRLRITELLGSLSVRPAQVTLPEGSSAIFTLALNESLSSNVTVSLTVPAKSTGDITVSSTQTVLSPARSTAAITITATPDDNAELRETHIVRAHSPVAVSTVITVITPPDPLPPERLCEVLDINEEDCRTFTTSDDSSAIWSASEDSSATGEVALSNGGIGDNQRSCLSVTLERPTRVAFRWRVSSQEGFDYLHYIDDGRRNPATGGAATGDKFLSGDVAWRDASFDYLGDGAIDIEWCYIKDGVMDRGDDAGFLDRLRITELLGSLTVRPARVTLPEGSSTTFILSLDETPQSNVTVILTAPAESMDDITISSTQTVLSSGQPFTPITINAIKDSNAEARETHIVNARSPVAVSTAITVITPPDPLPQDELCAALDIDEEDCPAFSFSTSDDSSAIWSASEDSSATGEVALSGGEIGDNQRSCLRAALDRPARVAFRWRVSSQEDSDYLLYIDDGQRDPATGSAATGDKFLSGDLAWRDASFDYLGDGAIDIEWCYIKDGSGSAGDDAGFLDRLRITELLGSLTVRPAQVTLSEGSSATFTLSLDETPTSNVAVSLTVPTESMDDIAVSPAQAVLSPDRPDTQITITAIKDSNAEARETHIVNAQSPVAVSTAITAITPPDPLPQAPLCAALDIDEEDCPTFTTSDDSSAIWSASAVSGMTGDMALRSETIGDNQRSCLRAALDRPARVAFRWRVSSQEGSDYLLYIDDGQRNPVTGSAATGDKFLSGDLAWRDASFDYLGDGAIDIEWCYIKDGSGSAGDDAGFLDRLRITELLGSLTVRPAQVTLSEGGSATFNLSLDETPTSNVAVSLTVPTESMDDIAVSPAQAVLSPDRPDTQITITAIKDNNAEARETHIVNAQSPVAVSTVITAITPPDPLPQAPLCSALDIDEEDCPAFSTSDDSLAIWSAIADNDAAGNMALSNGTIGDNQRSCLRATELQRPARVAFRWRVSSQEGSDYLLYIDDGQRSPMTQAMTQGAATGDKFLSGDLAWRDASFDYLGDGAVNIEWCYIKDGSGSAGDDAGFLDRLRITELLGSLSVRPARVTLSEGGSATFNLSLDETPASNVAVSLTVPTESMDDIAVSPAQVVLSPDQPDTQVTINAIKDSNAEARETHIVHAQSPVAVSATIAAIILPDPLPQDQLCAALDIDEEDCPKFTFTTSDDSSAIWSASAVSGMVGGMALRSGMVGDNQRSCLRTTLQPPARVAFRWRISSQDSSDYLLYIDDGRRDPAAGSAATGDKFLSGDLAWRDASFNYTGGDNIVIEWCYIKDGAGDSGDDAGFLDRLQIIPQASINLKVRVYLEGALQ